MCTGPPPWALSLVAVGPLLLFLPQPSSVLVRWGRWVGWELMQVVSLYRCVNGLCRPAVQPRRDLVTELRHPGGVRRDHKTPSTAWGGAGQGLHFPGTWLSWALYPMWVEPCWANSTVSFGWIGLQAAQILQWQVLLAHLFAKLQALC